MDDASVVGVLEGRRDVGENRKGLAHGNLADGQTRAKRFPRDERHRVEWESRCHARGDDGDDVRLLKPRREANLALEPLFAQPLGELWRQQLDDDLSTELRLFGEKDT